MNSAEIAIEYGILFDDIPTGVYPRRSEIPKQYLTKKSRGLSDEVTLDPYAELDASFDYNDFLLRRMAERLNIPLDDDLQLWNGTGGGWRLVVTLMRDETDASGVDVVYPFSREKYAAVVEEGDKRAPGLEAWSRALGASPPQLLIHFLTSEAADVIPPARRGSPSPSRSAATPSLSGWSPSTTSSSML